MESKERTKHRGCGCCGGDDEAFKGEAKVYGEKADYWLLHDEITDRFDQDLMARLNTFLDNLLIFVS